MIGTLRRELLDKILIVNERHLRQILTVYLHHFNTTRPHRTLGQLAPVHTETQPPCDQPRRPPDSPQTDPQRTHQRVSPRRMTEPDATNLQVKPRILYSSPTGSPP
jgi:hypothetical protein